MSVVSCQSTELFPPPSNPIPPHDRSGCRRTSTYNGVTILPSDDVCYESTDTLQSVYNGMNSAAAALAPFLSSAAGTTAFSLQTALSGAASVQLACSGMPPM